jgi:hypothetical protein
MDFKLVATVNSSTLGGAAGAAGSLGGLAGKALGGGTACKNGGIKVPLQVHGTTTNPEFVPDIGGAAASMLKSELGCAGGGLEKMGGLAGTAGGGAAGAINQLGGLLGKKKP